MIGLHTTTHTGTGGGSLPLLVPRPQQRQLPMGCLFSDRIPSVTADYEVARPAAIREDSPSQLSEPPTSLIVGYKAKGRHVALGKDSGLTRYIERLNNTLRQRISRLVRKTLSFPKTLENHIGALWMFIHDYNRRVKENLSEREESIFPSVLY